jgi:hypothetical protein
MEKVIKKNNKIYKYYYINDPVSLKIMFTNIIYFYNSADKNKIIGIDFEFCKVSKEKKNVSLIQINLENSSNIGFIFIFNPNYLTKNKIKIFIKFICSRRIIKIIHGGEALDIPYIFDNLFNKNINFIKKFLRNTYDTKFICEYLGIEKCNIYDLLYEFNVIDHETLNDLYKLNENIGPIHKINLDIKTININKNYEEYVINDVLYLPSLYKKMKMKLSKDMIILQELTNINFYIKRDFNKKFNKLYDEINKMNNYFIIDKNKNKIKLIDFFNYHIYYENNNPLLKYNMVTYFSQFIQIMIKCVLYKKINDKYIIYKSNNIKYNENINYLSILLKYPNITKIINTIKFNFL